MQHIPALPITKKLCLTIALLSFSHWMVSCDHEKEIEKAPAPELPHQEYQGVPSIDPSFDEVLDPRIINISEIVKTLNLHSYHEQGYHGQNLKIAIFDNGFVNLQGSLGTRLPPDVVVQPAPGNDEQPTLHGTKLAELIYGVTTGKSYYDHTIKGPELLLFNTNGFTNLRHAIAQAIKMNVDMVVYSQVWEYGGNQDGRGFINVEVNRATNAGILWVNAAGNYAESSYSTNIDLNNEHYVTLPDSSQSLEFVVAHPNTETKITLSWNDFTDTINYRSAQDLDLYLYDDSGNLIDASTLIQNGLIADGYQGHTHHAREIIRTVLEPGKYRVRVKAKTQNFTRNSRLTIAIGGLDVKLVNRHNSNSVFIPADNPSVLTVGAHDTSYSSFSATKPEITTISRVEFHDGTFVDGSSSAAAIAAAALAVWQSHTGAKLSHRQILQQIAAKSIAQNRHQKLDRICQRWLDQGLSCPYADATSVARALTVPKID